LVRYRDNVFYRVRSQRYFSGLIEVVAGAYASVGVNAFRLFRVKSHCEALVAMKLVSNREDADLLIVLVHGTWGRGMFPSDVTSSGKRKQPRWFEPESRFRTSLRWQLSESPSQIAYAVDSFEWSGSNSFIERAEAAERLAVRLDDEISKHPCQTQVLIGHSHGGTVCMLACKYAKAARPQIVTLATPFIELDGSDRLSRQSLGRFFADWVRTLSLSAFFYVYGAAFLSVLAILAAAVLTPHMPKPKHALDFPYTDAFYLLPYSWLHNRWVISLAPMPIMYAGYLCARRWADNVLDVDWALGGLTQVHSSTSILVLRGVDDEATLTLTAGAIGNRMSEPVSRLLTYAFLLALALLAVIWLFPSPSISEGMFDWIRVLFETVVPFVWLVDFLGCAFKSVYGRELLPWSLGLQIRSHSAPDHSGKLSVLTLPYRGRTRPLRHGLYDHELTTKCIASWIDGGFRLSPTLS
jgi:hypothetical protein